MLSNLYYHSESARQKLKIGVLLESSKMLRLFAEVLRDIARCDFAQLDCVIYNTPPTPPDVRAGLLWTQYLKYDQKLAAVSDDPLALEDGKSLIENVDSLSLDPSPDDAIRAVRAKDLDVILHFGFHSLGGEILHAARYGVWAFQHGDNDSYRGGPACFWELREDNPVSGVTLQRLTDGNVLAKGLFATTPSLSLNQNRLQPFWGSQHFVIQKLWELHQYGPEHIENKMVPSSRYAGKKELYGRPSNSEILSWIVPRVFAKATKRAVNYLKREDLALLWRIGVRSGGRHLLDSGKNASMEGFKWIEAPKGHFYADPFGFEANGAHWLFLEDYSYSDKRGMIACTRISPEGIPGEVRTILDTGSHLSYPYVFSEGDHIYMIPESQEAGVVNLYKAKNFPWEWEQVAELFPEGGADTTVWKQDGLWWYFTTLMDPRSRGAFLYLYYADSLTGKWRYHPSNPVCSDVRRARGAGRIHLRQGKLIRPSQDGSRIYGHSFTLNEITHLTVDHYEERPLLTVDPTWERGLIATHTYNQVGQLEFTDGMVLRPSGLIA